MIDAASLLTDTKAQVRALVDDLRATVAAGGDNAVIVDREHSAATAAGRTGLAKADWAEGLYAQAAVAWVLGCVFIRFCEDNDLVPEPLLAGPGPRRAIALDHRSAHLRANPAHDDRHWLREVFDRYAALPATGDVFGAHNPLWLLTPSADGARQLLQAFQAVDPDTGEIRHDFTDPTWDTRFLGDLYQDLSEHAKKTYALLQTPVFVEEFILDHTLEPALATFGLRDTTLIDPTCGSGHFLLGAFDRLFGRWIDAEPGTNRRELAQRALDALGGVDLNPFAAAIARFRLLVAALRAGGDTRLADAPGYRINIAVGDSLLHGDLPGRLAGTLAGDEVAAAGAHGYATEDVEQARDLLSRQWTVVVGNPPYITVKDPALNVLYRARFKTCHRQYSLGVPFTERFWQLARHDGDPERAGYIGMITANSFMKREFGKKLIEEWVPRHDLTTLIDTSVVSVPHHGTPTVMLFGRNRRPVAQQVRAVLGIKRNVDDRRNPEKGAVWTSITRLLGEPGSSNQYVSVSDLPRERLHRHPWSIGGGGAAELKERLDRVGRQLSTTGVTIGYTGQTNIDEAMFATRRQFERAEVETDLMKMMMLGEHVRDWSLGESIWTFFPYANGQLADLPSFPGWFRRLWPLRTSMWARVTFAKTSYRSEGRAWWEWHQVALQRLDDPVSIAFAEVTTHEHFALDRSGVVFNRSAPAMKLANSENAASTFGLLGLLNSSTASFWMKQVFADKGSGGISEGVKAETWERHFVRDGSKLSSLPVVLGAHERAMELHELAVECRRSAPEDVVQGSSPTSDLLASARLNWAETRSRMIAAQERLDWEMYRLYGLVDEDLTTGEEPEPPLHLGERAFEIVLARRMAAGEEESSWFARHGSTPITELPSHWPESYKRLVERRIELIETDLNIGLIEKPEHKRRWAAKPWDDQVKVALRGWLLDRLEGLRYWPEPAAITTTARLAAQARTDADFLQVARLYAGRDDVDVAALVAELVKGEAVPYLAALRYTDSGLRKHAQWLETWELQRREDAGEDVGEIPVPPKYAKPDFRPGAWEHRGKLDVPKERFISYTGAERETDASLPVGWAGWDHLARARALATWYLQAKRDGRDVEHLTPLLAGLAELVPWLKQWYDEPDPDPALDRPGSQIAALVEAELRFHHLTADEVAAWRPAPARRGRRRL